MSVHPVLEEVEGVEASQVWRHSLVEVVEVEGAAELDLQEQMVEEEEVGEVEMWMRTNQRPIALMVRPLEQLQTGFYEPEVLLPAH